MVEMLHYAACKSTLSSTKGFKSRLDHGKSELHLFRLQKFSYHKISASVTLFKSRNSMFYASCNSILSGGNAEDTKAKTVPNFAKSKQYIGVFEEI